MKILFGINKNDMGGKMKNKKILGNSSKALKGRIVHAMLIMISILFICTFICVGALIALSSGKTKPFLDKNGDVLAGSISEKVHVTINGIEQGMFIKGTDKTKPVLLFIHGGPGMPEYAISRKYDTVLEKYFIVCWWDQRGAGLSYNDHISLDTMTVKQFIPDTIGVTNYLRKRFGQKKIYLMAHSWGTFLGIQVAAQSPELYYAYIGMGQISNQCKSEKLAYKYMINKFNLQGKKNIVRKLEKYPIDKMDTLPKKYFSGTLRDNAMHSLGIGTTHNMKSVVTGIFLPVMENQEYTVSEKINLWRGKIFSGKANLRDIENSTDLTKKIKKLDIPVYFCHGIYDYTVSYSLDKDYFSKLQAPIKGFYTFYKSAHSPLFEEPDKFAGIVEKDILKRANSLSDFKNVEK